MEGYIASKQVINQLFNKDLAKYVMEFVEDPRINWAKNNFTRVIDDIEYADISVPDIRGQLEYHNKIELPEAFLAELLSLVKHNERCGRCRTTKQMWHFHEQKKKYATCNSCRYQARYNRLINMINEEVRMYRNYKSNREFFIKCEQVDSAKQYLKTIKGIVYFIQKDFNYNTKKARIQFINNTDLYINSYI